ncbi:MAG: TonB-dependent receptor plug domain-containing protein, partial [Bacteroidales bacterium]|nr:TonB-dependent receptor plug domain-containing protein [Bacteroidales bacterium]
MIRKIVITLTAVLGFLSLAAAQNLKVSGTVTDSEGYPLDGATVIVKGTATGVSVGSDGRYELKVTADAVLVASYLGYLTQELPVAGEHTLNFVLYEDTAYLDDVIVVAYGSMSKSDFTGSASQVSGDDIAQTSRESVDKALVGKMAGVRIASDSGDPGSAGNVQIRGVGSISAGTAPLYVVDGVVMSSSTQSDLQVGYKSTGILNTLNPEDIESVTVLKDAAAASLYGSRAANGVIIITTKRGKQGKTIVSYSGETGISEMAVKGAFALMNGPQFIQYLKDAGNNAFALNPAYSYGYTGE